MIPIFTPATARKDVNKVPGDGELAKLANLNRLVENVNTIVANGIPAAAPTLTYSNTGTLDSMYVNFNIKVPTGATYNSGGTKTVQSYYVPNVYLNNSPALTSITFPDVILFNELFVEGNGSLLDSLTSISLPVTTQMGYIKLTALPSLTTFNVPSLVNASQITIQYSTSLTSINFSNIITLDYGFEITDLEEVTSINFDSLQYIAGQYMVIRYCNSLTSFSLPEIIRINVSDEFSIRNNDNLTSLTLGTIGTLESLPVVNAEGNALDAASVNGILALLVSLDGTGNRDLFQANVYLAGGTNAAPTGQGIIDKQTLIDRGCNVETN